MGTLKEYILEAHNYFKLDDGERAALAEFTGILCGDLGEDEERLPYKELIDSLDPKEIKQLSDCAAFLEDTRLFKTINRNNLRDDIPLLVKVLSWAFEHDLMDDNWDLQNAYDKISENIK